MHRILVRPVSATYSVHGVPFRVQSTSIPCGCFRFSNTVTVLSERHRRLYREARLLFQRSSLIRARAFLIARDHPRTSVSREKIVATNPSGTVMGAASPEGNGAEAFLAVTILIQPFRRRMFGVLIERISATLSTATQSSHHDHLILYALQNSSKCICVAIMNGAVQKLLRGHYLLSPPLDSG